MKWSFMRMDPQAQLPFLQKGRRFDIRQVKLNKPLVAHYVTSIEDVKNILTPLNEMLVDATLNREMSTQLRDKVTEEIVSAVLKIRPSWRDVLEKL